MTTDVKFLSQNDRYCRDSLYCINYYDKYNNYSCFISKMVKWKQRSIFSKKKLRVQFDVVFDGGIFDALAPFGGESWQFVNLKLVRQLQPTQIFFTAGWRKIIKLKNKKMKDSVGYFFTFMLLVKNQQATHNLSKMIKNRKKRRYNLAILRRRRNFLSIFLQYLENSDS